MPETPKMGSIGWMDLTVSNASEVRDFYCAVAGWRPHPVAMGDYEDFAMMPDGAAQPVGGICHARGENEGLPPVWLIYIVVPDIDAALAEVSARGGAVVRPAQSMGGARYAVISDPAGAVCSLYQPATE